LRLFAEGRLILNRRLNGVTRGDPYWCARQECGGATEYVKKIGIVAISMQIGILV
jgi:hypothetical protein